MSASRQIKLGMFLRPAGHHIAAWRHPDAQADGGVNFAHYVQVAQTAERGLFDMLFSADSATAVTARPESLHRMSYVSWIDPYSLLAALAPVTQHIGLVCTATTTYDQPFHIARRFASLDLISGGRAGWNLVTSANPNEAQNFGLDEHLEKAERYRRAREFAQVVLDLWQSWDDDAFVRDKASGIFYEPSKLHTPNHAGRYFRVRGPLNVSRSPQGHPVIVQAGASDDGKELAAETAEVVFTAQPTIDGARAFYADLKARMAKFGRDPDHLKVMPGFFVTVGKTRAEAQEKFDQLQDLIHPEVGVALLSQRIGLDLRGYPLDGPLPELRENKVISSRAELISDMAKRDNLSIRQVYQRIAGGRGHYTMTGTATDVADQMEEWFKTGAADGFNVMCPYFPVSLDEFVASVVPELQRRNIYRSCYEGKTLRENLGLPIPRLRADHQVASAAQ
jgi:FMN-dependent oxidoreductase (nitrilotriacetate monooxygenase family)